MFRLRVKEVAEARGVNKSQLSRRADLALTTVNDLWDGTREDARMSTLAAIARALGVKISDLYEEIGNAPASTGGGIIEESIETSELVTEAVP
jgi:DNA-binding Xre family transcriptional regulator